MKNRYAIKRFFQLSRLGLTLGAIGLSTAFSTVAQTDLFNAELKPSDTGDYIVKINSQSASSQSLLNELAADRVKRLTSAAGSQLWVVSLSFERAEQLQQHAAVSYIEPDNYQQFYQPLKNSQDQQGFNLAETLDEQDEQAFYASADEILASLNHSEHQPYGIELVNADKVADPTFANKTLCIIDSGLQVNHSDFDGLNVRGNHSDYSGFWHIDQVQHGTHVAGSAVAVENGTGVVGVIKNGAVNVYVQKLSNGQPGNHIRISHEIEAMEVCANQGADVVSMSFGGATPYRSVMDVIDRLTAKGMLFIGAAGNHGRPVSPRICDAQPTDELKEACRNAHKAEHFPASFHNVMSVANINRNKQKSASSPINASIEVAAPGTNVLSAAAVPYDIFSLKINGAKRTVAHIANTSTEFSRLPLNGASCGASKCLDDGDKFVGKACLYQFDFRNFNITQVADNCAQSGGELMVMYPPIPGMGPIRGSFGTPYAFPIFSVGYNSAAILLQDNSATMTFDSFTSHHKFLSGTSMATPHVSGVATKVWSLNPQCTNSQIRGVLQHTSQDLGEQGRDVAFGFGLVDTLAAHQYIQTHGCDAPQGSCPADWYFNQAYVGGDKVSRDGVIYQANWWNKNSDPAAGSAAWKNIGQCEE